MITTARRMLALAALCGAAVLLSPAGAQEYIVEPIDDGAAAVQQPFTEAELDQLLAPIALYPDALLSQVLVAATYPLEVVAAARWSRANPTLEGEAAVAAVADRDWDPSVKSLVAFPDLLARMDADLEWTQRLGEAMLLQESDVMASIQFLRAKAEEAGTLADTEQVRVVREERTIIIEPARERVVYVPYYDTRVVYGPWWRPAYPPIYWPRPAYYSYAASGIYWSTGVYVPVGFFLTDFYWPHRSVVVVNTPRYYYPRYYYPGRYHYVPGERWRHDPWHRRHVKYRHPELRQRYNYRSPGAGRSEQRVEHRAQPRNYREFDRGSATVRSTQRVRGAEPPDELGTATPPSASRTQRLAQSAPAERGARAAPRERVETRQPADQAQRVERSLRTESRQRFTAPARIDTRQAAPARQAQPPRQAAPARQAAPPRQAAPARQAAPPRQAAPARQSAPTREQRAPSRSRAEPQGSRGRPAGNSRSERRQAN
ncbi:DUF3300 domain-containing protein [Thioalkalivibrio sp. XN8]|uniref:DUF3300 domain-containing protein n=1 Tax=Thioalkalivibrio sp. XN8 TaxID=2712863 RepID=UPI0013EAFB04|nr:DUF3300 domain-containing protein [Thioalkalivibrio sp. XN8]NGP54346.1 DUF3300 domain-containing protein [Thioalkalivibrio sp. XN8]